MGGEREEQWAGVRLDDLKLPGSLPALTLWDSRNPRPPLRFDVLFTEMIRLRGSASGLWSQTAWVQTSALPVGLLWALHRRGCFSGSFPTVSFPIGAKRMCPSETCVSHSRSHSGSLEPWNSLPEWLHVSSRDPESPHLWVHPP